MWASDWERPLNASVFLLFLPTSCHTKDHYDILPKCARPSNLIWTISPIHVCKKVLFLQLIALINFQIRA